ncbi:MAG: MBL fold metallo-hydrolase [Bacillota bacterium]
MEMMLCPLFSGSSGNAIYVGTEETGLLVDAGLSGRVIEQALCTQGINPSSLHGILITHEHIDHIKGAGVLSRRHNIPIYANEKTWLAMQDKIGPVATRNQRVFDPHADFYVRDIDVIPFPLSHDAEDPVGFCLVSRGKKIGIATDLGYVSSGALDAVAGCDALLLEANHDPDMLLHGRYSYELKRRIRSRRGHLSNEEAAHALIKLHERGLRRALLGHMSAENNMAELLWQTVDSVLSEAGLTVGKDIEIAIAHRDRISEPVVVGR